MIAAFAVSVVFLISYLTYHAMAGTHPYPGAGWSKSLYLAILASHTLLAAAVPFLAVTALVRAHRGQLERHRAVAKLTFPIWLYVSFTGVVVYLMLYRL